jgi:hypothetical protein
MRLRKAVRKGGVEMTIEHTGSSRQQNFSTRMVAEGVRDGWMVLQGDVLILKTFPEDLHYHIYRRPGMYCCHCDMELPNNTDIGQMHVATEHAGEPSPDSQNPSGYLVLNGYATTLDAHQHARYQAVPLGETRRQRER